MNAGIGTVPAVRITSFTTLTGMAIALVAAPQAAQANAAAMEYFAKRADRSDVPTLLSADDRTYYRELFAAIDRGDW